MHISYSNISQSLRELLGTPPKEDNQQPSRSKNGRFRDYRKGTYISNNIRSNQVE